MQITDEIPEVSGVDSQNFPRSSKLLGITHEFIYIYLWLKDVKNKNRFSN